MQVDRYIRAYYKQTEALGFEIQLPPDALTFLSTVDFLQDEIDPLLYGLTELTGDQVDYIHYHFFKENIADPDYFDYFLECDAVPQSKVKTQEELFDLYEQDCVNFILELTEEDATPNQVRMFKQHLSKLQDLRYQSYLQGVQDGRL